MPTGQKDPEDHASAPMGYPMARMARYAAQRCLRLQGQGRPVSVAPTPSISRECAGRKSLMWAASKISLHPSFFSGYQEAGIATDLLQQTSSARFDPNFDSKSNQSTMIINDLQFVTFVDSDTYIYHLLHT